MENPILNYFTPHLSSEFCISSLCNEMSMFIGSTPGHVLFFAVQLCVPQKSTSFSARNGTEEVLSEMVP